MDKDTRNAIERATQKSRKLIQDDFSAQLEATFDVLRDGTVAPKPGSHLSPRQVFQRAKIVAAIEHKRAAGMTAAEAVKDYLRDAAFTTLNRFVALKMLEARDLVQECISKGEQSAGYREFCGMAPGVGLLPESTGYRLYIESLFDELSTEIKVLFDRRDPASVLWPKRVTFEGLLDVLNATELANVWGEDETIGWFYQFFNSGEERRKMREESQAPRNSRELAIRNQFFTPRYVVEFLVDNTLGRIWLEMYGDGSALAERCRYFVRSEKARTRTRLRKDPRDLRILDPACGSGHFLLYCFTLLLIIYEEAWADPLAVAYSVTGRTVREDYPDVSALRRALPALIMEHNLYGVDIDPRAAQIAPLALWMRAQRAWKDYDVAAVDRQRIRRSHIVVAEPMPGDLALVEEFSERLDPPLLRDLFRKMVTEMRLAGELGALIPIEEAIRSELQQAREQFVKQRQTPGLLPGIERVRKQGELDLSGIDEDTFFHEAETRIVETLRYFAEAPANGASVRRRLFVDDAAQGIALIDLLRTRFDVVLMNPPFGKCSDAAKRVYDLAYPDFKIDIGLAFVDIFLKRLRPGGLLGAITSRTFIASDSLDRWRISTLLDAYPLKALIDLGYGVLDDAMVEACAYVVGVQDHNVPMTEAPCFFLRCLETREKELGVSRALTEAELIRGVLRFDHPLERFVQLPLAVIAYWLSDSLLKKVKSAPSLSSSGGAARHGLVTTDDFRFFRLRWELPSNWIGVSSSKRWRLLAKGGEYAPYYDDIHLCVDWHHDGRLLKTYLAEKRLRTQGSADWSPWLNHSEFYFKKGLTYPERTTSDFCPRVLPEGVAFSSTGQAIQFDTEELALTYLGGSFTRFYKLLVDSFVGSGDNAFPGSAAKHYRSGLLNQLPAPFVHIEPRAVAAARSGLSGGKLWVSLDETTHDFRLRCGFRSLREMAITIQRQILSSSVQSLCDHLQVEEAIEREFQFTDEDRTHVAVMIGPHPLSYNKPQDVSVDELRALWTVPLAELVQWAVKRVGTRRQITKKSHLAYRRLELISHGFEISASELAKEINRQENLIDPDIKEAVRHCVAASCMGLALGRYALLESGLLEPEAVTVNPFAYLRDMTPVRVQDSACVLADDPGSASDVTAALLAQLAVVSGCDDPSSLAAELVGSKGQSIRTWLAREYFREHVNRFSKSHRKAPIFWQLATPSARYSVWLYYHAFNKDTQYMVQNDCVAPKLAHEERQLESLRREFGENPKSSERKTLAEQERFVNELRAFLEEVKRVAPLWNPSLDDGVIINFAPLWRLVPHHKTWQKELKTTWDALCEGEYDWTHLAMHLWPERVVPRCMTDRSLAIAHGLEDVFWVEDFNQRWGAIGSLNEERDHVARHWAASPLCKVIQMARELWKQRYRDSGRWNDSWWQDVEAGVHDDHPLALLVWPERVCLRAFDDLEIAAVHGLTVPKQTTGLEEDKDRVRCEWVQKMLAHYSAVPGSASFLSSAFSSLADAESWKAWWESFDRGELDHCALARYLRSTAVAEKCQNSRELAIIHGVERFFFVDRGAGLSARLEPAEELSREVAERTSPAVKTALSNLINAPVAGAKTRDRSRRRARPAEVGGNL